ncbi:hypothetical protein SMICM304S_09584 [Streptomyces microflavus]
MDDKGLTDYLLLLVHDEALGCAPEDIAQDVAREVAETMTMDFFGVPLDADLNDAVWGRSLGGGYMKKASTMIANDSWYAANPDEARAANGPEATPRRLPAPTARRMNAVDRRVAEMRPSAIRLTLTTPSHYAPYVQCGSHPALSRRDVLRRWEELEWWACVYCDASFDRMVVAEVDHVVPLAKGGVHEWANLAPACATCNRLKSDRDMSDWLALSAGQPCTEGHVAITRSAQDADTETP